MYTNEEQYLRLKALDIAFEMVKNRTITKFDENLPNVEALTGLILNWSKEGKSIVEQLMEIQSKAQTVVVAPEVVEKPTKDRTKQTKVKQMKFA